MRCGWLLVAVVLGVAAIVWSAVSWFEGRRSQLELKRHSRNNPLLTRGCTRCTFDSLSRLSDLQTDSAEDPFGTYADRHSHVDSRLFVVRIVPVEERSGA
jgi:hypothetical protein